MCKVPFITTVYLIQLVNFKQSVIKDITSVVGHRIVESFDFESLTCSVTKPNAKILGWHRLELWSQRQNEKSEKRNKTSYVHIQKILYMIMSLLSIVSLLVNNWRSGSIINYKTEVMSSNSL